ncbi:MAG: ORF6N domain-containing protein, partial [Eubacterium sp.]|nr:ORF6N domain-containing protein [Eubacterium sp.]
GVYHDRFIVLDYGTKDERVFLCGASSRDAGARITSIVEDFGIDKYDPLVKRLLKNGTLQLP